jgi:hypothetical protein
VTPGEEILIPNGIPPAISSISFTLFSCAYDKVEKVGTNNKNVRKTTKTVFNLILFCIFKFLSYLYNINLRSFLLNMNNKII